MVRSPVVWCREGLGTLKALNMGVGQNETRGPGLVGSIYQGKPFWVPIFDPQPYGRGSTLNRRGYAGFGPCFHLPGKAILVPVC